jgi:hypothetical protein
MFKPVIRIVTIGHKIEDGKPLTGCRKSFIQRTYQVGINIMLIMAGVSSKHVNREEYDYTPYLGPDYKKEVEKYPNIPTFVSNHVSWLDILLVIKYFCPAFAAMRPMKDVPVIGILC